MKGRSEMKFITTGKQHTMPSDRQHSLAKLPARNLTALVVLFYSDNVICGTTPECAHLCVLLVVLVYMYRVLSIA